MASIIVSPPVLVKEQIKSINEAVKLAAFENPMMKQFHEIQSGIKGQREIIILNNYISGLSGSNKTACDTTVDTVTVANSTKLWDPKYIGGRLSECFDNYMGKFIQWGLKNGLKKEDLTNTDWANFIESLIPLFLQEITLRHAWFGDTAIVSGTGNNISAGNLKYFNVISGFWAQVLAIVAGDATKRVTIAKNAGASFALQIFDATDTTNQVVTNYFESMWYGADMRLRGLPKSDLIFVATQSVVDQYERERKKATGFELPYKRIENGIDALAFNGIDVVPFQFLDRMINAYFQNGTKWFSPHRALLVPKTLLNIGTEEEANLSEFDPFYDKVSKSYFLDYGFMLDAKIVLDPLVMSAY